jgi:hypothetical protein
VPIKGTFQVLLSAHYIQVWLCFESVVAVTYIITSSLLWFTFKLFGFLIFWLGANLMPVIPETRVRFYYYYWSIPLLPLFPTPDCIIHIVVGFSTLIWFRFITCIYVCLKFCFWNLQYLNREMYLKIKSISLSHM